MRRLPPLSAIRVFEAAARHEHFTAAADELGMTQAAVSYQIRALEERVGAKLFERSKGRVRLTDAGRRPLKPLTGAFDRMDAAFAALRADDESLLTISTTQTFANAWLVWRIGAFQVAHPDMAVRIETSNVLVDFASAEIDLGIRAGRGHWNGLVAEALIPIDYTPMCSPEFLKREEARLGRKLEPADLLDMQLFGNADDPWWSEWFRTAGVEEPPNTTRPVIRLDSQANEGHAAMAGQGMALMNPFFWRNDLADRRLVGPFDIVSKNRVEKADFGYWLVYPEHRRNTAKIKRFCEWLLPLVRKDQADVGDVGLHRAA